MDRYEKLYNFIKENKDTPYSFNEIAFLLHVKEEDLNELAKMLNVLLSEKKIKLTKKKRYKYNKSNDFYIGEFIGHEKGYGFIKSESFDNDIYVSKDDTNTALNGDLVKFKLIEEAKEGKSAQGIITEVLKRKNEIVIGTFSKGNGFGFVITDDRKFDKDIFISKKNTLNAKEGQKVLCRIIDYGDKKKKPEGIVTEIIGYFNEDKNDIKSVIKRYELREEFDKKALEEAKKVNVRIDDKIISDRLDLRDKLIITIDGEDAKDLDDAISLEITNEGDYYLGVHIADVSHYVKMSGSLDKEAYKRGTSIYLADRVLPMLPKEISNGICSLHPDVERLTLSIFMTINKKGDIKNFNIKKTVIISKHRMTYDKVTKILNNEEKCDAKLQNLLFNMKDLAMILRSKRQERGSLDFNFPECKVVLDENNVPIEIKKYELTVSNYIIEEFMLIANETIAEYVYWQNIPFIYRIHEQPDPDKMNAFKILAKNLGFELKGKNEIHPKALLNLLNECKGHKSERVIQTVMLRSLMKARYSSENKGHFGLSTKFYCHFTSPIRRYPDLIVHRIIKHLIDNEFNEVLIEKYQSFLDKAAEHTSLTEQIADNAERDTIDIKKAEYMAGKIGEEFEGIISSVTNFGIFVELNNTVEGLIRYSDIDDDYYIFNDKNLEAIGERTGKVFAIGDFVLVKVISSYPQLMEINFELVKKL